MELFGQKIDLPRSVEGEADDQSPARAVLKNCFIGWALFFFGLVLAIVVAVLAILTYKGVQMIIAARFLVPIRTVNHGIWPNYRHEFFDDQVPFARAESVCLARNGTLLSFANQQQEDLFDMYIRSNFWDEKKYPDYLLWTRGYVLKRRIGAGGMTQGYRIVWPDKDPKKPDELTRIKECGGWYRCMNQERCDDPQYGYYFEAHIVKDYVESHLIPPDPTKVNSNETDLIPGCWQVIRRNDIRPEFSFRFVCQRNISKDDTKVST